MKKFFALIALNIIAIATYGMSYSEARQQALFLTDKMAYELNLNEQQYEDCYEINLDYMMGVVTADDVYGPALNYRNADLRHILYDWQYDIFMAADYFLRPLRWLSGAWFLPIYSRYDAARFFYGRPRVYAHYHGGHGRFYHTAGFYVNRRPHHWAGGFRGAGRGPVPSYHRGHRGYTIGEHHSYTVGGHRGYTIGEHHSYTVGEHRGQTGGERRGYSVGEHRGYTIGSSSHGNSSYSYSTGASDHRRDNYDNGHNRNNGYDRNNGGRSYSAGSSTYGSRRGDYSSGSSRRSDYGSGNTRRSDYSSGSSRRSEYSHPSSTRTMGGGYSSTGSHSRSSAAEGRSSGGRSGNARGGR